MYRIPRMIDINARSRVIRDKEKLLIIGRCIEVEHGEILKDFIKQGYAILSVCLEEEHINHVGFKLAGILIRNNFKEVSVLTVDGSPHCTQLHWMVEEVFKFMKLDGRIERRHYVYEKNKLIDIPIDVVKYARYLSKIKRLLYRE